MLKKMLKSYDFSLIITYFLLCLFGLMMIYSASIVIAIQHYEVDSAFFYNKQKLHLFAAFFLFIAAAIFPYKAYKSNKFLVSILLITIASLLAIFTFGHVSNNARSWFKIGTRMFQPSEFAKLTIIIYFSAVYAKKQSYINDFNKGVMPPLVFLTIISGLIIIQPDIGTTLIIIAIGMMIILTSGMRLKTFGKLVGTGISILIMLSPLILLFKDKIFTETRMNRFYGFFDPFTHEEAGYQLVNSYLAIGSGGVKGLGLGQSVQKLGYLPEAHTDFIMAIIAEELGVFGVLFVIIGLAYIVLRGMYIAMKHRDPFGSMLAIGIAGMIGVQTIINLGGVVGLLPITGVTLPFISYGGSSLFVLSISMGILVNISMFMNYDEKYKKRKNIQNTDAKITNSPLVFNTREHN